MNLNTVSVLYHGTPKMSDLKLVAVGCLCLLLITAGCVAPEREPDPQLVVELEDISVAEEQIRMTLFILFTGDTEMTLHDVELAFVSDDGSIRRTVTVGSLPANESAEYPPFETNVTSSEPPKEMRFRIGRLENPDSSFQVHGYTQSNTDPIMYDRFRQEDY